MTHRVEIEVGRHIDGEYNGGLFFSIEVEDSLTIEELFKQTEQKARKICEEQDQEFVELMIRRIR